MDSSRDVYKRQVLGLYDGFFGPGAGTFVILAFTALCRFDLVTASGNANVVNFCSNLAAFVTFALAGEIVWALGVPAAVTPRCSG